jgi:hypothetical protein
MELAPLCCFVFFVIGAQAEMPENMRGLWSGFVNYTSITEASYVNTSIIRPGTCCPITPIPAFDDPLSERSGGYGVMQYQNPLTAVVGVDSVFINSAGPIQNDLPNCGFGIYGNVSWTSVSPRTSGTGSAPDCYQGIVTLQPPRPGFSPIPCPFIFTAAGEFRVNFFACVIALLAPPPTPAACPGTSGNPNRDGICIQQNVGPPLGLTTVSQGIYSTSPWNQLYVASSVPTFPSSSSAVAPSSSAAQQQSAACVIDSNLPFVFVLVASVYALKQ